MQACSDLLVAHVGVRRVTVVIVHIGLDEVVVVIHFCVAIFVRELLYQEVLLEILVNPSYNSSALTFPAFVK